MNTIRLGRIGGIPVDLDASWFLIFILLSWMLATSSYPAMFTGWPAPLYWLMGAVTALGLFLSVLLHELGHSLVAFHYKVPVHGITLFLFGGVARLGGEPPHPLAEFLIAIGGPLVSLALGLLFLGIQPLTESSEPLQGLISHLGYINLSLLVFNLIPGYPLDGGRVLRALLWVFTRNLGRATVYAAQAGRVTAALFIGYGLWRLLSGHNGGAWTMLIGWFLYSIATRTVMAARVDK
ncbi:MAG TPA: site-2 protease family protein [Gammaproteobacteria bacterium]|nr:site-2 protease family protein [Gammaproteobacteria bacterium]